MSFIDIIFTIFIGPLQLFFEVLYSIAYRVVGNVGLTIVVLSLAMNFLVLPLYKKADEMQARERDTEAKLKKGVDHIKKTFKGDDKMMILQTYYRQNNYSPIAALKGSVSLLLEIPFFIAAYRFLAGLSLMSGVSFGPIKDLGAPDALLVIGGLSINLLPILMTAINIISSAIYSKDYPLKTKIQLYGMAIFFLIFLYKSPSGLVFYWTLNNLFSLVKTIIFKIKNAQVVLRYMSTAAGILVIVGAVVKHNFFSTKALAAIIVLGIILEIPMAFSLLQKAGLKLPHIDIEPSNKLFTTTTILLTVLIGLLIPSAVINDSTLEFVDPTYFVNPIWFIVSAFTMSIGLFIVWIRVFYSLADKTFKVIFESILLIGSVLAVVDYMFFGKGLGNMNSSLIYDGGMIFESKELLINIIIVLIVSVAILLLSHFLRGKLAPVALVAAIAVVIMSIVNINGINKEVSRYKSVRANDDNPEIALSTEGQNVVFIMLDRAMGLYLPYIMNERPELMDAFDGFTYYNNVVSYAGYTNMATPALFGGYDYTPDKMNEREDETLKDKHNEALSVVPLIFSENGYNVTLFNPSYANYQWIPDNSIFDEYEGINAYLTYGRYTSKEQKEYVYSNNKRNFFCYSLMKALPLCVQPTIYDAGAYNSLSFYEGDVYVGQSVTDKSHSTGLQTDAMDYYYTVSDISNITKIIEDDSNNYFMYVCELAHDVQIYKEPEYVPMMNTDNSEYDEANASRFILDGKEIKMDSADQMAHYESNMASLIKLAEWFDYLKENDIYDNTRIVIVADHGMGLNQVDDCLLDEGNLADEDMNYKDGLLSDTSASLMYDMNYYYPLMMVKDFNSSGFNVNSEFMTNADTPSILTEGLIDNPVNPFTGNEINADVKNTDGAYILISDGWGINANNGSVFFSGDWVRVEKDMRDKNNWTIVRQNSTSPYEDKEFDMDLFNEMRKKQGY